MPREKLPPDGARYQCSFEFLAYGKPWRCDNDATEAYIDLDVKDIPKNVALHGRALCETHLQFFGIS
jgi:hypothetical protein